MFYAEDLSSVEKIMKFSGMWNGYSDRRIVFLIVLRHVLEVIACVSSIVVILLTGLKANLGLVMFFSAIGTLTNIQSVFFFWNHKTGLSILEDLEEDLLGHEFQWETDVTLKETHLIWKYSKFFTFNALGFLAFYFILPGLIQIILDILEINKSIIPPIPFQGVLNQVPKRSAIHYLSTLSSYYWCFSSIIGCIGNQTIIGIYTQYYTSQVIILVQKFKNFKFQNNHKTNFYTTERKLVALIKKHQKLISVGDKIVSYFGFPFSVQCVLISACLCLLMFACLTQINDDINLLLTNIFCLVFMILIAGIPCFLGQRIETQSHKLFETIYKLPWYEQSPQLRKYINFTLMQARRGMRIHYRGRTPLNLRTFLQILNTSYSYFMVLKSTL